MASNETQTVSVVEDDEAMRRSICALLQADGLSCRAYPSAERYLDAFDLNQPGCIVLDLRLGDLTGLALMRELIRRFGYCPPAVIVTGHGDVNTAVEAMKEGAIDFLEKPFDPKELLVQVRDALARDAEERRATIDRHRIHEALETLSGRERTILAELLRGKPNKQIAFELKISEKTVATHRAHILKKMQTTSLVDLVRQVPAEWIEAHAAPPMAESDGGGGDQA